MPEWRIELHGKNSGLLDTLSADSMEGLRSLLILKLEAGLWTFNDGDTLKIVEGNTGYVYVIAEKSTVSDDSNSMTVYTGSYHAWAGYWTTIRKRNGMWRRELDDRKPRLWKTAAGAESKLKELANYDPKKERVVMRLRWED